MSVPRALAKITAFHPIPLTADLTRGIENHITRNAILLEKTFLFSLLSILAHERLPATFGSIARVLGWNMQSAVCSTFTQCLQPGCKHLSIQSPWLLCVLLLRIDRCLVETPDLAGRYIEAWLGVVSLQTRNLQCLQSAKANLSCECCC
jgi:hypothetical protein